MIVIANTEKNMVTLHLYGYLTQFCFRSGNEKMMQKFTSVMVENIFSIADVRVSYYDTKNELNTSVCLKNATIILPNDIAVVFETKSTDCAIKLAYALGNPSVLFYVTSITRVDESAASLSGI